jgi:hypothetical protein
LPSQNEFTATSQCCQNILWLLHYRPEHIFLVVSVYIHIPISYIILYYGGLGWDGMEQGTVTQLKFQQLVSSMQNLMQFSRNFLLWQSWAQFPLPCDMANSTHYFLGHGSLGREIKEIAHWLINASAIICIHIVCLHISQIELVTWPIPGKGLRGINFQCVQEGGKNTIWVSMKQNLICHCYSDT